MEATSEVSDYMNAYLTPYFSRQTSSFDSSRIIFGLVFSESDFINEVTVFLLISRKDNLPILNVSIPTSSALALALADTSGVIPSMISRGMHTL